MKKQYHLPMEKVKKSNAICRARWTPENIYEPRIVAILASKIQPDDIDFKEYQIPVTELFGSFEYGGKDYKKLKSTVESLMSKTITIQEENGFAVYPLFGKGIYDNKENLLKISINSEVKHHFLELKKNYTQYNLMEFLVLSSTYAQRLFEYLKSWEDCETTQIEITELHKILGVPDEYKKDFYNFKRRALVPALNEIMKKTDLEYTWNVQKQGRKITHIVFINSRPKKKNPPWLQDKINKAKEAQQGSLI